VTRFRKENFMEICSCKHKGGPSGPPTFPELGIAQLTIVHFRHFNTGWRTYDITPSNPPPHHEQKGWGIPDGLTHAELKTWAEDNLPPSMIVLTLDRSDSGDVVDAHLVKVPPAARYPRPVPQPRKT
jgi:hypothetical protein